MNSNTHRRKTGLAMAIAAAAGLLWAVSATAQEMQPPAPEEASSALEHPAVVGPGQAGPIEALPAVQMAFYLVVNQEPQPGNWDFSGTVESVSQDRVVFSARQGEARAELLYRLPGGEPLRLEQGAPISVTHTGFKEAVSSGFGLDILSGERGVAAGARASGEIPQTVNVLQGAVSVRQTGERLGMLSDSKYDTTYETEAVVDVEGGQSIPFPVGEPAEVVVLDQVYEVTLLTSTETVPTEAFSSVAEGNRFALEFAITPLLSVQ